MNGYTPFFQPFFGHFWPPVNGFLPSPSGWDCSDFTKGEKKAIKLLETFEYKPEKYAERVNHIFEVLGLSLFECYDMTEKLYKEVKKIATEINNFLNEENSDERKQI